MKEAFSSVLVSRRRKEGVTVYKNVARKRSFEVDSSESSLQLNEMSEIKNIKQVIDLATAELQDVTRRLNDHLSDDEIEKDIVCTLVESQQKLHERIQELSGIREKIYEKEILQLHLHRKHALLSCCIFYLEEIWRKMDF